MSTVSVTLFVTTLVSAVSVARVGVGKLELAVGTTLTASCLRRELFRNSLVIRRLCLCGVFVLQFIDFQRVNGFHRLNVAAFLGIGDI